MPPPSNPYQPYVNAHRNLQGPGDARPTALQVIEDAGMMGKLTDKIILITGCSSGIGVTTAAALYAAGATLLLTARDMAKLEKVINEIVANPLAPTRAPRPEAIEIHLNSLDSVKKGAELIKQKINKLDILILNAGVVASPLTYTDDGLEMTIGVNHFSHFLLFQHLLPLFPKPTTPTSSPSRVIVLSSAAHRFSPPRLHDLHFKKYPQTYNMWISYGQSKTANIHMSNYIHRHYFQSHNIVAVSVHPGGVPTELGRHLTPKDLASFDRTGLANVYKSAEQGAATTVWATVSEYFGRRENGGVYCADVGVSEPWKEGEGGGAASAGHEAFVYDQGAEESLWKVTLETVRRWL